jgi:ATP-dependent DNA helicase DinG
VTATRPAGAVAEAVAQAFAADGPLAQAVSGFVPRAGQTELALAVAAAIDTGGTLVAEAGTGTGKTYAYLVPALLAGGKALISTATRALQDQVYGKDLNAVTQALGLRVEVAVLKGRQNYICLHRLARTEREGLLSSRQEVVHLRAVLRFAAISRSGDRAELAEVPESAALWPAVTSTRENCLGGECPRYDECFVYRARRAAQAADVVVVNHHLFLADLALRDDAIREFLPLADTVVLDEAHQLSKIAADFFGSGFSIAQLADFALDTRGAGLNAAADGAEWLALTRPLEDAARQLRLQLAEAGLSVGSRTALERIAQPERLAAAFEQVAQAVQRATAALAVNASRAPDLEALLLRGRALDTALDSWRAQLRAPADVPPQDAIPATEPSAAVVRWVGVTAHGAQFTATPLAPGEAFARSRAQNAQAWILTSATLTVAGRFEPFLAEIGLPDATTRRWDSPFDFARQALLYLPQPLPSPLAGDFPEQVADAVWPVIEAAGGRTFVLCSTLRAVERVAARLAQRRRESEVELPLLVQGDSTRQALLQAFRTHGNAVLVGSVSFWEGIDVRGPALSVVAIDKLPFAPPDDPVVEARIRRLRALGRNPFVEYQLPQAVTLLRQGAGRLIRSERDHGVLLILDGRLLDKSYGKTVLASLPPLARTRDLDDVRRFLSAERETE